MKYYLICSLALALAAALLADVGSAQKKTFRLRGDIVSAESGAAMPARVYIQSADGAWHFPASMGGSAVTYKKQRADNPKCVEMHTTLSAHPFTIDLPPGKYAITVERGKEYVPLVRDVVIKDEPIEFKLPLKRWINLAELGWYSGETHVHRALDELPNIMLAEDLNVAFPLTAWVREAYEAPRDPVPDEKAKLIKIDDTHVIYPRNTEYEILRSTRSLTLGRSSSSITRRRSTEACLPSSRSARRRAKRALDIDKPNWPWSMIVAAAAQNRFVRTRQQSHLALSSGFPRSATPGEYMKVDRDLKGFTERGWIDFGFQNYYALLNCGFRMPDRRHRQRVHPCHWALAACMCINRRGSATTPGSRALIGNSRLDRANALREVERRVGGNNLAGEAGPRIRHHRRRYRRRPT